MKKICIFCSLSSFNTGMPISVYKLAAGLAGREGVSVCAVLPSEGELAKRLRDASVSVHIVPFQRIRRKISLVPQMLFTWVVAGSRLYKFIRDSGINIVHFSDVIDAPYYIWARAAGAKNVAHVRVCIDNAVVKYLYRVWTNTLCSRIITVSKFIKRRYGFGKRASIIYNPGPDRKIFDQMRYDRVSGEFVDNRVSAGAYTDVDVGADTAGGRAGMTADTHTVIAVSSFRRDKGLHNFIEIAAEIKNSFSGNVNFVIVGGHVAGHEGYYEEVAKAASQKGLDGCLTVTGNIPHEEVAAVMSSASVLIHAPDWEEALGGVVLEAMAMGVAVVAYDCGGIGECFTDGESGYLVKRGDANGAAQMAISLLSSGELRDNVALTALKELDKKFTIDLYVNGVLNIYDALVEQGIDANFDAKRTISATEEI